MGSTSEDPVSTQDDPTVLLISEERTSTQYPLVFTSVSTKPSTVEYFSTVITTLGDHSTAQREDFSSASKSFTSDTNVPQSIVSTGITNGTDNTGSGASTARSVYTKASTAEASTAEASTAEASTAEASTAEASRTKASSAEVSTVLPTRLTTSLTTHTNAVFPTTIPAKQSTHEITSSTLVQYTTDSASLTSEGVPGTLPPSGLSGGAIAGIVVGSIAGVLILVLLVVLIVQLMKRNQKKKTKNRYLDDDLHMDQLSATRSRPPSSGPSKPPSMYVENGEHISMPNSYGNPTYATGAVAMATKPQEVQRRSGLSKEERMLQAQSRASMGPVYLGEGEGDDKEGTLFTSSTFTAD